ncbi:TetR/AcrR family transcriptional regulator [Nonomuraea sp. NPDC050556]|uniref:TetR/AcrR family transcriptional regulator n=1 Tax=Nonomuraea sp. NPDC050556 TaxID=3364369 RepID=UPI00378B6B6A
MSPQRSNRSQLIDGTLRCLERLPLERVTARVIAEESGANLASITYHFGSKDNLVTEAVIAGLDRWLTDIATSMEPPSPEPTTPTEPPPLKPTTPAEPSALEPTTPTEPPALTSSSARFHQAAEAVRRSSSAHTGLARNFLAALSRAQHDERVRELLADGFARTRVNVARLLDLGEDETGTDAGALVVALFNGLLFQALMDPALAVEGERLERAQLRLLTALPATPS